MAWVLPGDAPGYSKEIHGVLGIKALKLGRLSLDFQAHLFSWER